MRKQRLAIVQSHQRAANQTAFQWLLHLVVIRHASCNVSASALALQGMCLQEMPHQMMTVTFMAETGILVCQHLDSETYSHTDTL